MVDVGLTPYLIDSPGNLIASTDHSLGVDLDQGRHIQRFIAESHIQGALGHAFLIVDRAVQVPCNIPSSGRTLTRMNCSALVSVPC